MKGSLRCKIIAQKKFIFLFQFTEIISTPKKLLNEMIDSFYPITYGDVSRVVEQILVKLRKYHVQN